MYFYVFSQSHSILNPWFLHLAFPQLSWSSNSFFLMTMKCSLIWMFKNLLHHSPSDEELSDRLQSFVTMSYAVVNISISIYVNAYMS